MRSRVGVGGLIGRAFFWKKKNYTPTSRYIFKNRFGGSTSLQISEFREYTRSNYYEMEEEYDFDSPKLTAGIRKGDIINLHDLLFTNNRDYLVRYNNQQVKAKELEGKVIAILYVPLVYPLPLKFRSFSLMEVYNNLRSNNGFEVVFIAINGVYREPSYQIDAYKRFVKWCSFMPWTAIPFSDIPSSGTLQRRFGFRESNFAGLLIVDSTGMVLQSDDASDIIELYGALGYPFTDERIKYLKSEDLAAIMRPSLNTILASPQCDYVISNKGEKVPVHTLEDKVVALFFYEDYGSDDTSIDLLKMAYEELAKNKENFEVVLVYRNDTLNTYECTDEESFWKRFKTMPWLAVPFNDQILKKLIRIFEYSFDGQARLPYIVIFEPRGEFIEPYGESILNLFGIPAYPFTRRKVVKLETKKVKELKLELLWDPSTVFRREDGSQVPFSQLFGKKILIFFERNRLQCCTLEKNFLVMLKRMYLQTKGTHDEFEVIYIFEGKIESAAFKDVVGDVPWLVSPASECLQDHFGFYFMYGTLVLHSTLLAFAEDGRVVRKTVYPSLEGMDFPFCTLDLEEEALCQLNGLHYWDCHPRRRGRIYSVNDPMFSLMESFFLRFEMQ